MGTGCQWRAGPEPLNARESIGRIRASPFLARTDKIRGFVFDVTTGKLNKVR